MDDGVGGHMSRRCSGVRWGGGRFGTSDALSILAAARSGGPCICALRAPDPAGCGRLPTVSDAAVMAASTVDALLT